MIAANSLVHILNKNNTVTLSAKRSLSLLIELRVVKRFFTALITQVSDR